MEKTLDIDLDQTKNPIDRRNFISGLWHGAFLALGMALTQPTTVISAFVAELTGSTIWVGGLATVLTVASAFPQLFVARWLSPVVYKKPYLLGAIYLRVFSWATLAFLIYSISSQYPLILAWSLVSLLILFYAGGGLANVPYMEVIGKVIPPGKRGAFFGGKSALAAPLSIGAAFLAKDILAKVNYPNNYALLFALAALGLGIASFGFVAIKEPASDNNGQHRQSWHAYFKQVITAIKNLRELAIAQLLTGFSLMVLPFYVVYAREELGAPPDAVGWFLLAQVVGGILLSPIWARVVDRSGSRLMLFFCAILSTLTPLLAILLSPLGWQAMLIVFFLSGATFNGRVVGFQSSLLDLAPPVERGTYAGANELLILPVAFLSLIAGFLLQSWSYQNLFLLATPFIGAGAVVIWIWMQKEKRTAG